MGAPVIREAKRPTPPAEKPMFDKRSFERKKTRLNESKKKLLDAIGRDSYGGIDIFEGTTPAASEPSGPAAMASPLSDQDPSDPGVDISGIVALGGSAWSQLIK